MNNLEKAGLTQNETKVYSTLIDLGPSLAGQIARKSGLHRRTVYDTTEMLIQKGLIGYILKNNRRLFKAEHPNRILEILQEKQNTLSPIVDGLAAKYNLSKEKEETNFYKGIEGLKSVFEDQLQAKEILILGASHKASEVLKYYLKWYHQKRVRRKIQTRIIAQSRSMKTITHAEVKYLPKKYSNPVSINIWGDKLAIILWAAEPYVVVIQSNEVAKGYRNYFELMWNVAKK